MQVGYDARDMESAYKPTLRKLKRLYPAAEFSGPQRVNVFPPDEKRLYSRGEARTLHGWHRRCSVRWLLKLRVYLAIAIR